jgi:HTH-type transcriptional regulator/antitoxin HigA
MTIRNTKIAGLPGTFISEELEKRGWIQSDLAYILGVDEATLSRIIHGKVGISIAMAKALGQAFDIPAEFFTNLQDAYDLARADSPDPAIAIRGRIQDHYPLREMIKRGWIEESDPKLLEAQLSRFFDVKSFDAIPHLAHAAKRAELTKYENIPASQLAWLFRVRQIAKTMIVPHFSKKALEEALQKLVNMRADPEEVRHVPRLLQESGVRFVVVEKLPGGKIDGVCFWLKNSPVIGMSLRHDRIDNFWFVLRHEIEHVLRKHGQAAAIIDVDIEVPDDSTTHEESLANLAAAEFCVAQDKLDSFYSRKKPLFSERDTIAFARRMEVHPGIIVGQIQRRAGRWDFLRRHQVKIRRYLGLTMHMDGWGDIAHVEL